MAKDNSDSEHEDKSDPIKEPEVILQRSERKSNKINDLLRNMKSTKGQSYTNIKKCVQAQKITRNGKESPFY